MTTTNIKPDSYCPQDMTVSLDLGDLTMRDLEAIYDAARSASDVFAGVSCQPRCEGTHGGDVLNAFDNVMSGIIDACAKEAWRRDRATNGDEMRAQRKLALSRYIEYGDMFELCKAFTDGAKEAP
jgi:hypothetical protein